MPRRRIRKKGFKGLILGFTDQIEEDYVQQFKLQGANDVLSKPLNMPAFETIVRRFLGERRKEEGKEQEKKSNRSSQAGDREKGHNRDRDRDRDRSSDAPSKSMRSDRGLRVLVVDDSKPTR